MAVSVLVVVLVLELPCKIGVFWHEKHGSYGFFGISYLLHYWYGISHGIGISYGICLGHGIGIGPIMQNLSLLS